MNDYQLEGRGRLLLTHVFDPTPGHGRGCFPCCRLRWLARATWDDAERQMHRGGITLDEWDAWTFVWSTSAVRYSTLGVGCERPPLDPYVAELADAIRSAAAELQVT